MGNCCSMVPNGDPFPTGLGPTLGGRKGVAETFFSLLLRRAARPTLPASVYASFYKTLINGNEIVSYNQRKRRNKKINPTNLKNTFKILHIKPLLCGHNQNLFPLGSCRTKLPCIRRIRSCGKVTYLGEHTHSFEIWAGEFGLFGAGFGFFTAFGHGCLLLF